ncbi:MAG: hypothetical protein BWY92_01850 [Firmicutes bacterium ADurb.BinA052]|nr:MAG: hypothetical protein BWY92_01850 [Firmicutes bacterium ADurb.BinA052]
MNRERFFHSFRQTARRAGVDMHEFPVQALQRLLGGLVVDHRVGVLQLPLDVGFVLLRQVIDHVPFLVYLAALDEARLAGVPFHRRSQGLAAVENVQPRRTEIQAALHQFAQQRVHHSGIFGGSLAQPQYRFAPVAADAQRHNHLSILERGAVDQYGA